MTRVGDAIFQLVSSRAPPRSCVKPVLDGVAGGYEREVSWKVCAGVKNRFGPVSCRHGRFFRSSSVFSFPFRARALWSSQPCCVYISVRRLLCTTYAARATRWMLSFLSFSLVNGPFQSGPRAKGCVIDEIIFFKNVPR